MKKQTSTINCFYTVILGAFSLVACFLILISFHHFNIITNNRLSISLPVLSGNQASHQEVVN
jgi:hypothetical protein